MDDTNSTGSTVPDGEEWVTVPMPGPDGGEGWAVVSAEVANDPEKLAQVRKDLHAWVKERWETDAVLDDIEQATGENG